MTEEKKTPEELVLEQAEKIKKLEADIVVKDDLNKKLKESNEKLSKTNQSYYEKLISQDVEEKEVVGKRKVEVEAKKGPSLIDRFMGKKGDDE